jgi:intracellular septation protein A
VTFKVFGLPALTILFILAQLPFVGRETRLAQAETGTGPARSR